MPTKEQIAEAAVIALGGVIEYRKGTIKPWYWETTNNWWVEVTYPGRDYGDDADTPSDTIYDAIAFGKKEIDRWWDERERKKRAAIRRAVDEPFAK